MVTPCKSNGRATGLARWLQGTVTCAGLAHVLGCDGGWMSEGADDEDEESKTEDASPQRIEQAFAEGDLPMSHDLIGVVSMVIGLVVLAGLLPMLTSALVTTFRSMEAMTRTQSPALLFQSMRGLALPTIGVFIAGGAIMVAGPFAGFPGGPVAAILAGLGLMAGSTTLAALTAILTIWLINGVVWFARLHYRLLKPALNTPTQDAARES